MILRYWPPDPIDRSNVNVKRKERKEWKEISFFRPYESFDFINITFE